MTAAHAAKGEEAAAPLPRKPRTTFWVFTWNNYTDDALDGVRGFLRTCEYGAFTPEKGEAGTPHLQGMFKKGGRRQTILKELGKCYLAEMKAFDTDEAYDYAAHLGIHKDKPRDGPTETFGLYRRQMFFVQDRGGMRTDIMEMKKMVDQGKDWKTIVLEHPTGNHRQVKEYYQQWQAKNAKERDVDVLWFAGPHAIGKSRKMREMAVRLFGPESYYCLEASNSGTVWWDGYGHQPVLIIDDCWHKFNQSFLMKVCDNYPMRLDTKGGFDYAHWRVVLVGSNLTATQTIRGNAPLLSRIKEECIWGIRDNKVKLLEHNIYQRADRPHIDDDDDAITRPLVKRVRII